MQSCPLMSRVQTVALMGKAEGGQAGGEEASAAEEAGGTAPVTPWTVTALQGWMRGRMRMSMRQSSTQSLTPAGALQGLLVKGTAGTAGTAAVQQQAEGEGEAVPILLLEGVSLAATFLASC